MALPTTPFEDAVDDFAAWTTLAEEETFLFSVADQSVRVSVQQIGVTASGNARPIYETRVGYPAAPTALELRQKEPVLIINCQHGDEPSGRDAALQHLRNLAETQDAGRIAYLQAHPLIYVTTANPDGFAANSRTNAFGRDVNRQYLDYRDNEAETVGLVLRHYQPVIVIDTHERGADPAVDFETLYPTNVEVDGEISTLAQDLHDTVKSALVGAGFTVDDFPGSTRTDLLRNNVGLQNLIGLLVEPYGQGNIDGLTRKEAVSGSILMMDTVLDWHVANEAAVSEAFLGAQRRALEDGVLQNPISDPAISAPLGYELTDNQRTTVAESLDRLRIADFEISGAPGRYVPMAQPSKRLIPFLMDAAAAHNVISATAVSTAPDLVTPALTARNHKVREVRQDGARISIQA